MILIALLLQAAPAALSECDDASDFEIVQCWDRANTRADAELDVILQTLFKLARDADRAFVATQRRALPSAAADLKSAQRAWMQYRDIQCDLESDSAQGGSLQPIISGECHTEMTRARIKQLQDLAARFREK